MNILNLGLLWHLASNSTLINESRQYDAIFFCFVLISLISSYLLGSINSAIIISKAFYGDDIRNHGSGNAGLTNMLRTYSKGAAGLTLLGDMLKTAIAVLITALLLGFNYKNGISLSPYCYMAGLSAVIGHIFPIYYGFKGGKGVLATATMALIVTPLPFLILITVFVVIVAVTKFVSLGSICVAALYPIVVFLCIRLTGNSSPIILTISTLLLAVTVVWCHRTNIQRLASGTERKLSFKKKDDK